MLSVKEVLYYCSIYVTVVCDVDFIVWTNFICFYFVILSENCARNVPDFIKVLKIFMRRDFFSSILCGRTHVFLAKQSMKKVKADS